MDEPGGRAKSHRDLVVWQKSMDLTIEIYRISDRFPPKEQYRLTSQITRAAASVPANIAEGNARISRKEYVQFLAVARGSLMETETFLTLAERLGYVSTDLARDAHRLITEVSKMIVTMQGRLRSP